MQKFLDEGILRVVWKRQNMALLLKAGKPIYLLDTTGMGLERINLGN